MNFDKCTKSNPPVVSSGLTMDLPAFDLMRIKAAAAFLGWSVSSVYRAMANRGLPARRLGERWVFSRSELYAWVKKQPGINLPTES